MQPSQSFDDPYAKCCGASQQQQEQPEQQHRQQELHRQRQGSSGSLPPETPPSFAAAPASPFQQQQLSIAHVASSGRGSPGPFDGSFSPTAPGAHEPFATRANAAECMAFLQSGLDAAGARTRLPDALSAASDPAGALPAALNAAHELLALLRRSDELRLAQEEAAGRLRSEARAAGHAAEQMRGRSEQRDQEAAGLKIKLRQLEAWYRSEVARLGAERDDLARRGAALEQRHAQFGHELRRRDGEVEKLQGRVRALLRAPADMRLSLSSDLDQTPPPPLQQQQPPSDPQRRPQQRRATDVSGGGTPGGLHASPPHATARARRGSADATGGARILAPGAPQRRLTTGGLGAGSAGGPTLAAAAGVDPLPAAAPGLAGATWHEVRAKLAELQVRAQRVKVQCGAPSGADGWDGGAAHVGSAGLFSPQASTPHERLLVAKLMEASQIMAEQEQTLKVAIAALAPAAAGGRLGGGA